MPGMIQIDDKIVSTDLLTEPFCCDPAVCRGACCVEGNAGAPLDMDEVDRLEEEYEAYRPYMKPEGIEAIEQQGFMVVDTDGDYTTPLIDEAECAYSFEEHGVTLCAIERAAREGHTDFLKPLSCHLYPIRVVRFNNGTLGLNYHRWDICHAACVKGRELNLPVYRALREPIVRAFGEEFFQALTEAERLLNEATQASNE